MQIYIYINILIWWRIEKLKISRGWKSYFHEQHLIKIDDIKETTKKFYPYFSFFNKLQDFNFNLLDKSLIADMTKLSRSSDLRRRLGDERVSDASEHLLLQTGVLDKNAQFLQPYRKTFTLKNNVYVSMNT